MDLALAGYHLFFCFGGKGHAQRAYQVLWNVIELTEIWSVNLNLNVFKSYTP